MPYATRLPSAETVGTPPPATTIGRPSEIMPVACVQRNDVNVPSVELPTTTEPSFETEFGKPLSKRNSNVAAAFAGAADSTQAVARSAISFFIFGLPDAADRLQVGSRTGSRRARFGRRTSHVARSASRAA